MTSNNNFNFSGNPLAGSSGIKMGRGFGYMNPADNPLSKVEATGNAEEDSHREFDALAKGFRERRAQEDARFKDATDSGYYFAVVFQSNEDRDAFVASINRALEDGWWINGYEFARALGLDFSPREVE